MRERDIAGGRRKREGGREERVEEDVTDGGRGGELEKRRDRQTEGRKEERNNTQTDRTRTDTTHVNLKKHIDNPKAHG